MWEKFGCEECDNYNMLVVDARTNGTKSEFQSWCSQWSVGHPAVGPTDGGSGFASALGAFNGYNYHILPDRSARMFGESNAPDVGYFDEAGVEEHECGSVSNQKSVLYQFNKTVSLGRVTPESIEIRGKGLKGSVVELFDLRGVKHKGFLTESSEESLVLRGITLHSGIYILNLRGAFGEAVLRIWK